MTNKSKLNNKNLKANSNNNLTKADTKNPA